MKAKIIQAVDGRLIPTIVDLPNLITAMEVRGSTVTGTSTSRYFADRPHLDGQPTFSNFCGPMHDVIDGQPAIRYEDREAYRILSA